MPVSLQSQIGGKQQADQALAESISSDIRVAIPGVIQSFDSDAVTCVVLPAVKGYEADSSGKEIIPAKAGGEIYMLRMDEYLAVEAAWNRKRLFELEEKINALTAN